LFSGTLPTDTTYTDTLTVSPSFTTGSFTVAGFAVDAGLRRAVSAAVTVNIQSVATDNTPPVVSHTVPARVEATDTITCGRSIRAHRMDRVPGGHGAHRRPTVHRITPARFDSLNVGAGNLTE